MRVLIIIKNRADVTMVLYYVQNDMLFQSFTLNALNDISGLFNNYFKKFSKQLVIESVLIYQLINIVLVTTHCSGVSCYHTTWHKNNNQSLKSQENIRYNMYLKFRIIKFI